MSEITHFSHEHPLILRKHFPKSDVRRYGHFCYCCDPLSSWEEMDNERKHEDVYVCELCEKFFLHKSCAKLPTEIIHKSHEKHPLILSKSYTASDLCHLCSSNIINNECYNCDLCMFHLHIKCALGEKENVIDYDDKSTISLNHPSHKTHSLTLLSRPAAVLCDACDHEDKDFFYHCLSCRYQIHRHCALLPSTNYRKDHPHPLHLLFGLPSDYHCFNFFCDICQEEIHKTQQCWVYYCKSCRYFVHVKCMAAQKHKTKTPFWSYYERYDKVYLPTAEIAADLIKRILFEDTKAVDLIKRFMFGDKELVDIKQEIQIFSHKQHPLVLCHDKITEDVIEDDEEILCDGCNGAILLPPYYRCAQCRYFLHFPCANLPRKLTLGYFPAQSLFERFFKFLKLRSKSRYYEEFTCEMCANSSNGFYYEAKDKSKVCLDVKCATILSLRAYTYNFTYKHESHHHPLIPEHLYLLRNKEDHCKGCNGSTSGRLTFGCPHCKFDLHYDCVMLPESTRHRFDSKHPLILRFPPHAYHEDPFDCAECEKEIHPSFWLFHCEECDLSFHTKCINDTLGRFKFGQKLQISTHSHPLRFVSKAAVKGICKLCEKDIHHDLAFECQICNYHVCRSCAKLKSEHMS